MLDMELREFERCAKESGAVCDIIRFRFACARSGNDELAGLIVGDILLVDEVVEHWVHGPWEGELLKIEEWGAKYVRPIAKDLSYRVRPSPEYFKKGLLLTSYDKIRLVRPILVFQPNEWYCPKS